MGIVPSGIGHRNAWQKRPAKIASSSRAGSQTLSRPEDESRVTSLKTNTGIGVAFLFQRGTRGSGQQGP